MNLKELHSFKLSDAVTFHDKLNPKLWMGVVLRPEVKDQLMTIAQDFLEELGVHDLDVKDITISGSNAAYSYTKHSDLDLHILVDMGNLPVDEVYRELFTAKKTIYNDTHDIKIHGIPVELYVQDSRQPVVSLGEYSVMHDKWLKIPTKRRSNFDQTSTKSKYEKLLGLIEIALQSKKYSKVKHIIDTIKRYRQAGLDKGGEFGPENLAYKMLRSQGYITKLYELRDKLHSEKLSFETMYQNIDEDEQFNNELWKPGLDFKQDINGILYHVTNAGKKNDFLSIKAYDKKNPDPIGDAQFAKARNLHTGEVRGVTSMKTRVDPKYQGQGIAANMYALIRMLGVNVLPSETQTTAGQKMWSKWRKQGDVNSLKDLDPKVKGVAESENNDTAISLSKLGKFHPGTDELAEFVPERATAHYALHPDKWESTFYSLTNKDSDKLKYYGPKKISIPSGTLVGDMAIANKFYRAKTSEEKQHYAEAYKASLQSYPVDVSQYRMPELLIPRQNVDEAFDTPLPITWEKGEHGDVDALAKLPDGTNLSIMFNKQDNIKPDDKTWMVEFYRNNSQEVTGEGDAQKVFSTVLTAIQQFIKKYKPLKIYFSASKEMDPTISYGPDDIVPNPESRAKLYDRMVLRYAKSWGYKFFRADNGSSVVYQLSRMKPSVGEEYNTMQFAAEKTPAINPYGGLKDNQYRGAMSEAVTDNYLYHSIESMDTFRKIINTGEIKPKTPIEYEENDIEMPVISASRNQYYRFPYGGGNIQFVIDKDALKHSGFKVKPYSYAHHYTPTKSTSKNELHKQETEEQIFPFKGHGIPVKQPYIVGIQINPKFKDTPELEEIQKLSKSVNIPVSFMKTANKPAAKKVDIKLTPKFDPNRFVISPATGATKQYFPMMMYDKETKHTYGLDADYTNAQINDRLKNVTEAADKKISFKVQKGKGKFSTTLTVNNSPAGIYQYDSNTGRSIAEVYPEFKGKGLGKLLVLHAIYTAAQLGLDFQEDESRTAAYDNVLDSLSSNGYIVDDDGYWYVTGEGEQYLKQSLNEASGYIPSEKEKNDPRFKTALTVDVHPDTIKKNAKAFYWNTSRAGIPPTAKANGKIS